MIDIIITSYNEPKSTLRAVETFLKQIGKNDRITVVDPFQEVGNYLSSHVKDKRFNFFLDSGEGKSYALNLLFAEKYSNNKNNIFILSDGDVYVSENAVKELVAKFKSRKIGCVTGKPVSIDSRETKYGYWSKLLYSAIDGVRKKLAKENKFFQCSGYLFAMRNGIIGDIPLEVPEDAIIPYLFWKKGYYIDYAEKAEVYVKYPDNWKDWVNQRVRTIKAHENIPQFAPDMPRTKSFLNELKTGSIFALTFPRSFKEFFWTLELYFARLYIYIKSFWEMKKNNNFNPGWRETTIESTKTLD
ncbi:MAG: glycosyltransferase family 2 protein [Nanoarchaeota archaeon]|nr:glycosyltransferase family 2 protein [Nanoarchaeota archaeon]